MPCWRRPSLSSRPAVRPRFSARAVATQAQLPLAAVSYYFPRSDDCWARRSHVVLRGGSITASGGRGRRHGTRGRGCRRGHHRRAAAAGPAGAVARTATSICSRPPADPVTAAAMAHLAARPGADWSPTSCERTGVRSLAERGRADRPGGRRRPSAPIVRGHDPTPGPGRGDAERRAGRGDAPAGQRSAEPVVERAARDPFVGLDIPGAGSRRRRRPAAAAAARRLPGPSRKPVDGQPVPDVLLVERRLHLRRRA